ncbi:MULTISPECIES: hypothetical protein [Bacillus cereus group]|uniref:SH3 domain-containing protein n=1 Tax=Bacillus cereus TaxID=1396 RepID=A0A2C0E5Z6_BACCE|nr:hypothetical protein [Bacillus cereus]PDY82845.1 hypothetical protein CON06_09655 [Bacillus cereus]PFA02109.1 hypothetical protein CN382_30740 [Bacillus cereus]PFM37974.1 hypothetical protein COJ43_17215 [Bacillus cereus]PGL57971.1 hypothetical protein CN927_21130 [Bacillus cereus]PGQ07382.1 hypothetical protein COA08_19070 [Bacillus cereus]
MFRRLSIFSLVAVFVCSLFGFNSSAFASTDNAQNTEFTSSFSTIHPLQKNDVSGLCTNGGKVGVYGANVRKTASASAKVVGFINKDTNVTGTWVNGEYVQGHYDNSSKWLYISSLGGYISKTTLINTCGA